MALCRQSVGEVEEQVFPGHPDVMDADLADDFGTIPRLELMKPLLRRIVDPSRLYPIQSWLEYAVEETGGKGRGKRTTQARPPSVEA